MKTQGLARVANLKNKLARELNVLVCAFSFFTRLPLRPQKFELERAVLYLPLVGLWLGGLSYFLALGLKDFLSPTWLAFLLLVLTYYLADFFHFDGLLDTIDALCAHVDRKERLNILKTPEVGALGLLFAFFFLLGEFLLVKEVLTRGLYLALLMRPLSARVSLSLMAILGRPAKKEGLGFLFMKTSRQRLLWTQIFWLLLFYFYPVASVVSFIGVLGLRAKFKRAFGGLTGDLLGATAVLIQWLFLVGVLVGGALRW